MPADAKPTNQPHHSGLRGPQSALRSPAAHLRLWIVAALCLGLDLVSKYWAFTDLPHEGRVLVPSLLEARRSLNSGALFGSFSGWVPAFVAASLLALGFVIYVFACSHRRQWFTHLGLAFILAGALGNLYDRSFVQADVIILNATAQGGPGQDIGLITSKPDADPLVLTSYPDQKRARRYPRSQIAESTRHGVVRDFIKFTPLGGVDYWPWVFNVADALLVAGVGILMVTMWRDHRASRAAVPRSAPAG